MLYYKCDLHKDVSLIKHKDTHKSKILVVKNLFKKGTGSERPNSRKAHTRKAHFIGVPERPTFGYQKGPFFSLRCSKRNLFKKSTGRVPITE